MYFFSRARSERVDVRKKSSLKIPNFNFQNLDILVTKNLIINSNVSFINYIIATFVGVGIEYVCSNDKITISFIKIKNLVFRNVSFCSGFLLGHPTIILVWAKETWLGSSSSSSSFTRYAFCYDKINPRCVHSDLVNFHKGISQQNHVHVPAKLITFQNIKGKNYLLIYYYKLRLILSNDVETNPGPKTNNLFISTYNLQGCGDKKKLKRINSLFHKLPYKLNCVINLQETHFTNCSDIKYHWKWGSVVSNGTSNSCGVAILYNSSYFDDILGIDYDSNGRYCALHAAKDEETYLFINVYAPNDHKISIEFFK